MMLAIYRKYRPKVLSELYGQKHIVDVLQNAARQSKFAHAYLLYGSRGSGKTTTARLIAKLANCDTRIKNEMFRKKGEPCNKCLPCKEIDAGRALDVLEIDAASNRGIDEIRNLKEGVKVSPALFAYKVFIIDEAHMLTREAFNALLKTLEEPPSHVILILATTEYEKVPPTIASRAQRFHFHRLGLTEIVKKLKLIVTAEKIKIADDALELIAALADGSFRDAESLLDQMVSLDQDITISDVERIVGKLGYKKIVQFAELLLKRDLNGALQYLNEVEQDGHNIVQFTKDTIHYLRKVVTLKLHPKIETLYQRTMTHEEIQFLKSHSNLGTELQIIALIRSFIRAYSEMRYSPFAGVPLEVAVIENLRSNETS